MRDSQSMIFFSCNFLSKVTFFQMLCSESFKAKQKNSQHCVMKLSHSSTQLMMLMAGNLNVLKWPGCCP